MKCRNCKKDHPLHIRCEVAARMSASNAASNGSDDASNKSISDSKGNVGSVGEELADVVGTRPPMAGGPSKDGKHQRWDREAYNRYQREYMRNRRKGIAHG